MENIEEKRKAAVFEVLLSAAMWSTAGIFIKLIPWNGLAIAALRSAIAGTVAFAYMRIGPFALAGGAAVIIAISAWCVYNEKKAKAAK